MTSSNTRVTGTASKMRIGILVESVSTQVMAVIPAFAVSWVDMYITAELDVRGLHRKEMDTQVFLDDSMIDVNKVLEDGFTTLDVFNFAVSKGISDTQSFVDQFSIYPVFIRESHDVVNLTDSSKNSVSKKVIETISITDATKNIVQKKFSDSFGLNELLSFSDGTTTGYSKRISNIFTPLDAPRSSLNKKHSDSVTFTDSGSLLCQGYVDMSYFAGDYVGSSASF